LANLAYGWSPLPLHNKIEKSEKTKKKKIIGQDTPQSLLLVVIDFVSSYKKEL
jgi:hypothetical protein